MEDSRMDEFTANSEALFGEAFPIVLGKTWKKWSNERQVKFRNMLATIVQDAETIRAEFDGEVWKGHDNGSVKRNVESVRTRTQHKSKPGRPAPTIQELRAKALAKKGIVIAPAESEVEETEESESESE